MMSIKERWQSIAGQTPPLGYMLRDQYKECWLRIHSLPQGKRYAEDEVERTELLKRYTAVFNDCFSIGDPYLIIGFYQDLLTEKESISWIKSIETEELNRVNVSEDDESYFLFLFAGLFKKDETIFREIIVDVANEKIKPLLFFSDINKIIYAPYDGGIDLFFLDREKILIFKNKYKNWLSPRADGL